MFYRNTIKKAVMKLIDEHIKSHQELYENHCKEVDANAKIEKKMVDAKAEMSKVDFAADCVKKIASKLLS